MNPPMIPSAIQDPDLFKNMGDMNLEKLFEAAEILQKEHDISVEVINLRRIRPLDR